LGFVGNLFNGSRGMGWNASGTDIQQPATMGQANTAYDQTQQGLANQNAFLQALQGQNALQNQTKLTGTLQDMVQGGGPNPALSQFYRTQGKNLEGTSAAIASAPGARANPAAAARTIASLSADANMKAATDAATLKQQQQLGAIGALGGQLNNQVTNLGGATNAYSTAAQNSQMNINNAINAANQNRVAMQGNINNTNATIANTTAQGQQQLVGGLFGGVGSALQMLAATGGKVKRDQIGNNPRMLAEGADPMNAPTFNKQETSQPDSNFMSGFADGMRGGAEAGPIEKGMTNLGKGIGSVIRGKPAPKAAPMAGSKMSDYTNLPEYGNRMADYQALPNSPAMAKGGKVPAMVSPGEKYLSPHQAQSVLQGKENPLNGKTFHGGKAKVKGDSYENDTIPVTLEEGGCVIPRSVLQSDQPMKNAIKFVHEHMRKMAKGGKVEHKANEHKEEKMKSSVSPDMGAQILSNGHFLMSAEAPHVEPKLKMSHKSAFKFLKDHGFDVEEALGKYPNKEGIPTLENSFLIHNVNEDHLPFLYNFARDLGQESAIHSKGLKHEFRYLNGDNAGSYHRGAGTEIHMEEPENYYTKTKNGLIFSHDIDFNNTYKD